MLASYLWTRHCRRQSKTELIIAVLLLFYRQQAVSAQLHLHVGYITTDSGAYVSNGTIPAVDLAVKQVNEVFNDFQLVLNRDGSPRSISCDRRSALESYFDLLKGDGQSLIALVGCGCSLATEPVAEIANFSDVVHLSYASSSPSLSNRHQYPGFWRTSPSEDNFSPALIAIVNQYRWKLLKILTQEESTFIEFSETLTQDLRNSEIHVDQNGTTSFSTSETFANLKEEKLFSPEARVFVLNMYEKQARRVMCKAALLNKSDVSRYVPAYVWITHAWYKEGWWKAVVANDDDITCSDGEIRPLVERSLAILQIPTSKNFTAKNDVPLTTQMFWDEYKKELVVKEYIGYESTAALAYDVVWTLALALNHSFKVEFIGTNLSTVSIPSIANAVQSVLTSNFSFTGVSGIVEFDINGTRLPHDTTILKCRAINEDLKYVKVAVIFNGQTNLTYCCELDEYSSGQCETDTTVWPGGVPRDGIPSRIRTTIKLPLFVIYAILSTVGIGFVIVCLIFNILFRDRKIVKLTSPKLNYLILFGAFMLYASVFFYVVPSKETLTSTLYCHIRGWLQPGGYLFCFGTIVLKIWRVYYIFHNPSTRKKRRVPKDWMLALGVLVMFAAFATIMIGVIILGDYKATEVVDRETLDERDENKVLVEHFNLVCDGKNSIIWIAIIYFYIIATQLVAVYLAFRTRKVKIKALNDAKYLAIIIYMTTIILTVMIISTVSLSSFLNADAAVFSGSLLIFTTLILGLLFVPKMVILYKDPKGERIFNRSMSQAQAAMTGLSMNDAERDKLHDLEGHCKDLETRLGKYEHIQPFRSLSRSKFSGSTEFAHTTHTVNTSLTLTSSIVKPPTNGHTVTTPTAATISTPFNGTSSDNAGSGSNADMQLKNAELENDKMVQQRNPEKSTEF